MQAFPCLSATSGFISASRARLESSLGSAVERGKLEMTSGTQRWRGQFTSEVADVIGAGLVIEAVPEDRELKTSILEQLDTIVDGDTILASNTSSIPIAELGCAVSNPGRMLGLHFFSPVPVMKLVEVVPAMETTDDTVRAAEDFVTRLGKRPVRPVPIGFHRQFSDRPRICWVPSACSRRVSRAARISTPE